MPQMQFDWNGLIRLLAHNLYSEKRVFLRELIQNAHDAVARRVSLEPELAGRIDISTSRTSGTLTVSDNGIGMDDRDLRDYIGTVGIGATRQQQGIPGLIGQFGIGFLSAFIVADRVVVETRKIKEETGWRWTNTGSREYSLEPCDVQRVGTSVTVHVREADRALIGEAEIRETIKQYSDLLAVPIFIGTSKIPANAMVMPWEKPKAISRASDVECRLYIAEYFGDEALETIPFQLSGASGLLYITKNRVVGVDQPRSVRLFVRRMLVSNNLPEILPSWATFINGIINSDELLPTAARDNVIRDQNFFSLQKQLGSLINEHLASVKKDNPEKFSDIQRFHSLGLRGACTHFGEFFDEFVDLLEWRTNPLPGDSVKSHSEPVLRTLPEIIRLMELEAEACSGSPLKLRAFGSGNAASLFFRMGQAANVVIVDASGLYESSLLQKYLADQISDRNVEVIWVDKEDDPILFRSLGPNECVDVTDLAERMGKLRINTPEGERGPSSRKSVMPPTVAAKRFEPASIPALIRPGKQTEAVEEALYVLDDPNSPATFKAMARKVIEAAGSHVHVTINANNSLIQRLAREKLAAADQEQLLLGVYNSAFLSSDLMSDYNASILHSNLIHFMSQSIDASRERDALAKHNTELLKKVEGLSAESGGDRGPIGPAPKAVFVMIPFNGQYGELIDPLRYLLEDLWGCQLYLASDRKFEDRILDSVRAHIDRAHLFIAELTESNPNVMFELGAVFGGRRGRPVVNLFRAKATDGSERRQLPADLGSMIYVDYSSVLGKGIEAVATFLDRELRKDDDVKRFLALDGFARYVSHRKIIKACQGILSEREIHAICDALPTEEHWKTVSDAQLIPLLAKENGDAAYLVISRVRKEIGFQSSGQS